MSIVDDGDHAKRILEDEFFQRILNELREDTKSRGMATKPKEKELREEIYYEFQAINRIEQKLKTYNDRKNFLKTKR